MSIFPSNPQVGDEFSGKRWNGTTWEVIGVNLSRDYALESSFTSHTSASTSVHGIPDTSTLATQASLASASAAAVVSGSALGYASASAYTDSEISGLSSIYATTTTVNTKQDKSSAFVIVDHGTDANYTRPTGVGAVYWTGSVQPNNAAAADLWLEP